MTMERRIDALEEISGLLITAMRGMNESIQRLEFLERQREDMMLQMSESLRRLDALSLQRENTLQELSASVRRTDEAIQALMAFVPVTQAEIIRLDDRIDQIGGA